MESLKKDVHRPITILLWDYMTHHWVNVFDLGDNSTKKWVQKIHMGTFTYSDVYNSWCAMTCIPTSAKKRQVSREADLLQPD